MNQLVSTTFAYITPRIRRMPGHQSWSVRYLAEVPALVVAVLGVGALMSCSPSSTESVTAESGSATGQPTLKGTYTFVADGTRLTIDGQPRQNGVRSETTWEITPCGSACSRVQSSLGWTLDLHLIDGKWLATRETPSGCDSPVPATIHYNLDASTLTGTLTNDIPCGLQPSVAEIPATLTKEST